MKKTVVLSLCSFAALLAIQSAKADILADWTFQTSQPGVVDGPASPGAGVSITGIAPEIGSGTASALHAGPATYSSPSGNGSTHSFSSNMWTNNGDYYQFAVSTATYSGIQLSWEQISSTTGPRDFNLQYSPDGTTFTTFASYQIITGGNAGINTWSNSIYEAQSSYSFDLSSITAINNNPSAVFRLVIADQINPNGGTISTTGGGTDRVDDFTVSAVPEPTSLALAMGGAAVCLVAIRRKRYGS